MSVTALITGVITMVVVGTVVKGMMGLSSISNFILQTFTLYTIAILFGFTRIELLIVVTFPAVIHFLKWSLERFIEFRARRGAYGDKARWAIELFDERDQKFIHAQTVLPDREVREIKVVSDSKEELREMMVERYNELVDQKL